MGDNRLFCSKYLNAELLGNLFSFGVPYLPNDGRHIALPFDVQNTPKTSYQLSMLNVGR